MLKSTINKNNMVGFLSSTAECYNTCIFPFMIPHLSIVLFPSEQNNLMFIFSLLGIAMFLAHPLGSLYYGVIGDRDGRKKSCMSSGLFLGISTGCLMFIPEQKDFSWFLYFLICVIQNFFAGGEHRSAIIYSIEHTQKSKHGIASGFSCLFSVLGIFLAKLVVVLITLGYIPSWRIACFVSIGFGVMSYKAREQCQEPNVEKSLIRVNFKSLINVYKKRKKEICSAVSAGILFSISYNFIFVFLPIIIEGLNQYMLYFLFLYGIKLFFFGYLSSYFSVKNIMCIGSLILSVSAPALSVFSENNYLLYVFVILTFVCMFVGPKHAWVNSQFIDSERCRASMIANAITSSVFYSFSTPLLLLLYQTTYSLMLCGALISIFSIIASILVYNSK